MNSLNNRVNHSYLLKKGKLKMRRVWGKPFLFLWLLFFISSFLFADQVRFSSKTQENGQELLLVNNQIECSLIIDKENLISENIKAQPKWLDKYASVPLSLASDADFKLDVTWSGWKAPGKINNAENPVSFTKKDFRFKSYRTQSLPNGTLELDLFFEGRNRNPFELQITYRLEPHSFFIRRRLALRDSKRALHFLRWLWPRDGYISGALSVIKEGGFGQPAAAKIGPGGAFFGLEYPAAENWLKRAGNHKFKLSCGQVIGEKISSTWIRSEWTVVALTPEPFVKQWFWKYVDKIRAAPLRPYLLYNSWYDLRSPEIVKDQARAMTEENVLRTIASFKKRLAEKRGLKLDAFVLDDGWDIYRSDWLLNREQFPHGLSPLVEALQAMDCQLGLWLGPIGGYSHRDWRVEWMKAHGYEAVGDQMCVAGSHYHQLLKKRLTDFVSQEQVSYFKWDGIQFTCNEAGHGHLPDIYSRRAVMETVIDLCRSVRSLKPDIFINVTSGTWLSPWWLKYANTIWMQGYDYGYANVPSLNPRDRAMTYRDSVLYDDLVKFDFWFPIANLMTHGIIKGHLNQLGGTNEPLEKFTDNAVLYFARGIAMWELYVSPDFLTDRQWDILAEAIRWAKECFPLLGSTQMIGGDPEARQAYGYVHFSGTHGLMAVRNPYIESQTLSFKLTPNLGFDGQADTLVLERIYPDRWVSPQLYQTGSIINLQLNGYETAIYELYPLKEATGPLLAGRRFKLKPVGNKALLLTVYEGKEEARLLNSSLIDTIKQEDKTFTPRQFKIKPQPFLKSVEKIEVQSEQKNGLSSLNLNFNLKEEAIKAVIALLLEPEADFMKKKDPALSFILDGQEVKPKIERQEGRWLWSTIKIKPGHHFLHLIIAPSKDDKEWQGKASLWLLYSTIDKGQEFLLNLKNDLESLRLLPPHPFPSGEFRFQHKLGQFQIKTSNLVLK